MFMKCKKGFSQKGNLSKHLLTHTGEKPLVFEICSKEFSIKSELDRHLLSHIIDKPNVCERSPVAKIVFPLIGHSLVSNQTMNGQ